LLVITRDEIHTFELSSLAKQKGCLTAGTAAQWARMSSWRAEEACKLLSGLDPELYNEDLTDETVPSVVLQHWESIFSPHTQAGQMLAISDRSIMFERSNRPIEYLLWAIDHRYVVPDVLANWVFKLAHRVPVWGSRTDLQPDFDTGQKYVLELEENWIYEADFRVRYEVGKEKSARRDQTKVSSKRIRSEQVLLAVLAHDIGYRYGKPHNKTGVIRSAVELCGMTIDQGTVKRVIDDAMIQSGYLDAMKKAS